MATSEGIFETTVRYDRRRFWWITFPLVFLSFISGVMGAPLIVPLAPFILFEIYSWWKASRRRIMVQNGFLEIHDGKKKRSFQLQELTKLETNLGSASGNKAFEGVGTLTISSAAGDSLKIKKIRNVVALAGAIRNVSGPVMETAPSANDVAAAGGKSEASHRNESPLWVDTSADAGAPQLFEVVLPGYSGKATDIAGLTLLAQSGQLRSTTSVKELSSGHVFTADQIPQIFSDKDYVVALLLSVFLGPLGIDRFYSGQIGVGVAKLLTLGGLGIWWLIDLILYATRRVKDKQGRPLA